MLRRIFSRLPLVFLLDRLRKRRIDRKAMMKRKAMQPTAIPTITPFGRLVDLGGGEDICEGVGFPAALGSSVVDELSCSV
jgi:hypothetical protein